LKKSVEQESDDIEVKIITVEDATSLGDFEWHLCKTTSTNSE
jgi:hypothetical protein